MAASMPGIMAFYLTIRCTLVLALSMLEQGRIPCLTGVVAAECDHEKKG